MAIQQNVQQQNANIKAEIQRAASRPISSLSWLHAVLASRKLAPASGLLVRLSEIIEQEGNLMSGIWLTDALEFWQFEVLLSRSDGALLGVELFTNATPAFPLTAGIRGTGASFGYLARQVLREARGA